MMQRIVLCCVAVTLAACGILPEFATCTTSIEPALIVEIRDAASDAPLAFAARGVVRDGSYVDSLRPYESTGPAPTQVLFSRRAAEERAGTYSVEVLLEGYARWTQTGLRVERGTCHVETRRIVARLQTTS